MSFLKHGLIVRAETGARGKTASGVITSRAGRDELIRLFGPQDLPSSVMLRREKKQIDSLDEVSRGSYQRTAAKHKNKGFQRAIGASGQGVARGALSVFPQNVGRTILLFYSQSGDVVVDPFAGHNSRMQLVVTSGRHYVGYDICHRFMQFNRKRAEELRRAFPNLSIFLHERDSRSLSETKSESADFTITSPPYYDVEFYGDEPGQLGKAKTYDGFLEGIAKVMVENERVLKRGAFAAWFVNDFRRRRVFHLYHIDIVNIGRAAGLTPHDIAIVDFGPGLRDVFINQALEQKILPKRHEYCIVFRKELR